MCLFSCLIYDWLEHLSFSQRTSQTLRTCYQVWLRCWCDADCICAETNQGGPPVAHWPHKAQDSYKCSLVKIVNLFKTLYIQNNIYIYTYVCIYISFLLIWSCKLFGSPAWTLQVKSQYGEEKRQGTSLESLCCGQYLGNPGPFLRNKGDMKSSQRFSMTANRHLFATLRGAGETKAALSQLTGAHTPQCL